MGYKLVSCPLCEGSGMVTEDIKNSDLKKLHSALSNVLTLSRKIYKKDPDTAKILVRLCREAGVTDSILRSDND